MLLSRGWNRLIWGAIVIVLAILVVKTRDDLAMYFAGVGKLEVRVDPAQDAVILDWRGAIEAPMASRISEAFDRHRNDARRFVLSLSSPGGSLEHGGEMVRLLRRMRETHDVDTVVEARRICASMCVPVYLQGKRRTAAASARFMFHDVSFHEFHSKEELDVPEASSKKATDRLFARYFTAAGVPQSWIGAIRAEMAGGKDVWKTAAELLDENAGIVQAVF